MKNWYAKLHISFLLVGNVMLCFLFNVLTGYNCNDELQKRGALPSNFV